MKKAFFLLLFLLIATTSVVSVEPARASENSWISKAPMLTARAYLGAAVVNGKIFAIGGYNNGYLSTNEEYDPTTDT